MSGYLLLETDIAKINSDLKNEYLIYGSYEKLMLLYLTYIYKYEALTTNYYSFEMAKMYYQCSFLIINTGDINKFEMAEKYLEKAIEIVENMYRPSKEYANLYAKIYYLYSIVFEHRGDKNKALIICKEASHGIKHKKIFDSCTDVIERQVYLLTGDKDIIVNINALSKETDLQEIFQNRRRLFQLYLKLHDLNNAKKIFPELKLIVSLLENRLDKIYIGMYYRDIARFYYMLKEKKESELYFNKAIYMFEQYEFYGQKKMLLQENEEYKFYVASKEEKNGKNSCYTST